MSLLRFIKRERPVTTAPVAAPVEPPAPAPRRDTFAPPPLATPAPVDLDRIRRELMAIQNIVGAEETLYGQTRAPQDAVDVDMKLGELIKLCPQAFKDPGVLQQASQTVIQVSVPDLYGQLTQGKVATKLHLLTSDIPVDYLSSYAVEHADDAIPLPLHMVVGCIQPEDLRRRTASQERDLGEKQLPNLFTPGSVAAAAEPVAAEPAPAAPIVEKPVAAEPVVAEVIPSPVEPVSVPPPAPLAEIAEAAPVAVEPAPSEPAPVPAAVVEPVVEQPAPEPVAVEPLPVAIEPAPEAEVPVPEPVTAEIVPEPAPVEAAAEAVAEAAPEAGPEVQPEAQTGSVEEDSTCRVMLAGLDINEASAEELHARLGGVGLKLAQRIVTCRTEGGPYTDLFDLARVSGLRARRFEQVTGLPWNAAYFRHRDQVKQILGVADGAIPDVRQVAARFNELTDFVGCMIIHEDGLVLAQNWNNPAADALGAFAPQMFKKIHRYVKPLKLGEMNSICFFVGHQPITVVRSGSIYFAALHKPDKVTKKQISLSQALAMELGRRFAR